MGRWPVTAGELAGDLGVGITQLGRKYHRPSGGVWAGLGTWDRENHAAKSGLSNPRD